MNETLKKLLSELHGASAQARWAIGACAGLVLLVAGVTMLRARNPHFVVLAADLDAQAFNSAVTALAGAGIRYETTMGPAPYLIRVEESKRYEALNAIHLSGEFLGGSRGIASGIDGSSSVLLGQSERHQRTQKRVWEEAEMQLERLNFVAKAKVTVSGDTPSPLARMKSDQRRASVVLTLRGLSSPTASERRALVGIVRGATGVDDQRITIVDQHSNLVFDGKDADGVDSLLALEERFGEERTEDVQALLDRTFGPGLTVVGVSGTWTQVREESISETLDPAKKPLSQRSRTTESPEWPRNVGGPAGVAANTQEGTNSGGALADETQLAKTSEEELQYSFGSTTTHKISQPHQLKRLSISLVVDASIADRLADAEDLVKGIVGFDETRGDTLHSRSNALPGLERDAEGTPIIPDPVAPREATSPILTMALEHGLELVAGIAFLFVLMRSLKGARATGAPAREGEVRRDGTIVPANGPRGSTRAPGQRNAGGGSSGSAAADDEFDADVDLDALARAHIEELLKEEPERVSALLSRWALAEDAYAEAGGRR